MEAKRICPYCMGELESRVSVCPHCGGVLTGRNPGGQPAGGHAAGRAVYRGRDAEHRRRGHPVPGRGEHRAVPGDHQGVYAPDAVGGAGHRTRCSGPSWAARCCSRPPGWTLPISTAPSSASPPQTVWRLCWTCSRRTTPSTL